MSRVLNNSGHVSEETRERVLQTISELGYRPNQIARHLSRGTRVQGIGIISPFVTGHAFMDRLSGVQTALSEAGNHTDLILYNVNSPRRFRERLLMIIEQGSIAGLLIVVIGLDDEDRTLLDRARIRYLGLEDRVQNIWPAIGVDNVAGGRLATEYLLDRGHQDIAYIGDRFPDADEFQFEASRARYAGYTAALAARGITIRPEYVQLGPHGRAEAYQRTRFLLSRERPPTAIFAMSDVQALGALAAIRDSGLQVPDDISIIGYDDVEVSHLIGLTTVRQHLRDGGYLGMQYLLRLIEGDAAARPPTLPPLTIIERRTTQALN